MSASTGLYEQIKTDLGCLQLDRAAEVFATLAEEARTGRWTHIEFLARLLDEQAVHTRDRRLAARLRYAKFPFHKSIEDFDFEFQPSIDPKLVADLATLRFVEENRPILFLGQPGCGKTHLAVALAIRVVQAGWRGYFTTAEDMCTNLAAAKIDGTWNTKLRTYTAPTILVIDDVGLLPMPTGPPPRCSSRSSTPATNEATQPSSPPTAACPTGATSSATPSSQPPSWTGSCTTPSYSTSEAPAGDYENTTASRSPQPPTPANLPNRQTEPASRDVNSIDRRSRLPVIAHRSQLSLTCFATRFPTFANSRYTPLLFLRRRVTRGLLR